MTYDGKSYSNRSTLAVVLALAGIAVSLMLVAVNHVTTKRLVELEDRWRKQHDQVVTLENRVGRCDSVIDRALDSVALVRAIVLEERDPGR